MGTHRAEIFSPLPQVSLLRHITHRHTHLPSSLYSGVLFGQRFHRHPHVEQLEERCLLSSTRIVLDPGHGGVTKPNPNSGVGQLAQPRRPG